MWRRTPRPPNPPPRHGCRARRRRRRRSLRHPVQRDRADRRSRSRPRAPRPTRWRATTTPVPSYRRTRQPLDRGRGARRHRPTAPQRCRGETRPASTHARTSVTPPMHTEMETPSATERLARRTRASNSWCVICENGMAAGTCDTPLWTAEIDGQDARPGHHVVQRDAPLPHDRVSEGGEAAAASVGAQHVEH